MNRRTKEALILELEVCRENASKYFDITLNEVRLDAQLASIITDKIDDYFHQRFRDWTVWDLLAMREVLAPFVAADRMAAGKRARKKGSAPVAAPEAEEPAQAPSTDLRALDDGQCPF